MANDYQKISELGHTIEASLDKFCVVFHEEVPESDLYELRNDTIMTNIYEVRKALFALRESVWNAQDDIEVEKALDVYEESLGLTNYLA